jgi:predicted Rossmann-fold nucleotide-binding protein
LAEVLTLIQTRKVTKPIPLVIFGRPYWKEVLNIDAMVEWGTISEADKNLFKMVDTVDEAYDFMTSELTRHYLDGSNDTDDEPKSPALSPDQ